MGGCFFKNTLPVNVPKCHRKVHVFWLKKLLKRQNNTIWNQFFIYPSLTDIVAAMNSFFQERHILSESCITGKNCVEERKRLIFILQMKDLVLHSLVQIWDTFSEVMLAMSLECWEEKDLTSQILPSTLSAYTLSWYILTWLSTFLLATRRPHYCVAFLLVQSWIHWNYWTVHELSDL